MPPRFSRKRPFMRGSDQHRRRPSLDYPAKSRHTHLAAFFGASRLRDFPGTSAMQSLNRRCRKNGELCMVKVKNGQLRAGAIYSRH
jgi:hypothetical protein